MLAPGHGYVSTGIAGVGTFGAVFSATDKDGNPVAIKKVYLNPKFKNREMSLVPQLKHPNCLKHVQHYQTKEGPNNDIYIHLVTEYFPFALDSFIFKGFNTSIFYAKLYGYQMFAGLAYLHNHGICHRDIKPSNVLVDNKDGRCQLCDFGSAKFLKSGEESVSYIATRSYRAPELLLECNTYSFGIDVWSAGCVLSEMFLEGRPLFRGRNGDAVLNAIAFTIGAPKPGDLETFKHRKEYTSGGPRNSRLQAHFPSSIDPVFLDLLSHIFVWNINTRFTAEDCMRHPFFREVLAPGAKMPNGNPLPAYMAQIATPELARQNFPAGPTM